MSFSSLKQTVIDYDVPQVQNMIDMLKSAPFPDQAPLDAKDPWDLGMDFKYLSMLKSRMETDWKWSDLKAKVNRFPHFLADYKSADGVDELQLHFVHATSQRSDAIPLLLLHGWPGTFYDFYKIIEPLVNPPSSDAPAFHVVIPSIPGYFKSTLSRRDGWNLFDVAKLYNGLMTELLGYKKYVAQGGDWGSIILRVMSNLNSDSLVAAHFNMFMGVPKPADESELSAIEKRSYERFEEYSTKGNSYAMIQMSKPFTIGLAIASSPLAILAYISEKIYAWSDPSLVNPTDIIDTVALYFLSGSFATSVMNYNQALKKGEGDEHSPMESFQWLVKSKFGFSQFPYEIMAANREGLNKLGPLSFYKAHERGGHFPAFDCPQEFVEDLREFFSKNFTQ